MKKIVIILSVILILQGFYSCTLDYLPAGSIEQEQAFQKIGDARALRNYLYLALRGTSNGAYFYATDIQADLLNATLSYGNVGGLLYSWELYPSDYTVEALWAGPYSSLKNINNFIDRADQIVTKDSTEAAELAGYISEAHLTRAILYRSLILRYAKDYEPATAAEDPGVPLVLHYDITERPARATVAEVYDQIFVDIAAAEVALIKAGEQNAKYLTRDCITALKAQVYLETHQYMQAAQAADRLISSDVYPLVTTRSALNTMWTNDQSSEIIFQPVSTEPSEATNEFGIYISFNGSVNRPYYVPQQWVVDLFGSNNADIRKGVFINQYEIDIVGVKYPDVWLVSKYPGNPALYTGYSNYAHCPKVFRIAEMHLIKAEALAWNGASTEPDALAALNVLRTKRGLATITAYGDELKREIQEERTREMLCEGTRLYDLKRWKLGVERKAPQNTAFVITVPAEKTINLRKAAGDDFFVWGIPRNDILANPNIKQNPGWGS
ncbi:MAG: RagB/SusD family nutrient uptake outer membrane protein [Prevotellaceae bacterium]|nr:RagB/SusD family nutrient uptake outer membrane protein [Prevotellaceae bacterium]